MTAATPASVTLRGLEQPPGPRGGWRTAEEGRATGRDVGRTVARTHPIAGGRKVSTDRLPLLEAVCCHSWPVLALTGIGRCGYCGAIPAVVGPWPIEVADKVDAMSDYQENT